MKPNVNCPTCNGRGVYLRSNNKIIIGLPIPEKELLIKCSCTEEIILFSRIRSLYLKGKFQL